MSLISSLNRRYATKTFDPTKKISESDLHVLLESMRLAPSSFGLQPWKFLVVTNPELRAQLKDHSRGQPQVTDSSHLIVLCARDSIDEEYVESYIQDVAQTRGIDPAGLDGYKHMMMGFIQPLTTEATKIWTDKQAYIAQGFLLMAAAQMQIDACPMEGFDRAAYDKLLGLEGTGYHSAVIVPVGYRSDEDKSAHYTKVRRSAEEITQYYT